MVMQNGSAQLAEQVVNVLRNAFPNAAIKTDEGWHGRIHVKIVSPAFDGVNPERRQSLVWDVLRQELQEEAQFVSLVLPLGLDDV